MNWKLPDRLIALCVALACLGLFAAVALAFAAGDWIARKAMQ